MTLLARVKSFLTAIFRRGHIERDMTDEWQFHLESRVDDLVATGIGRAAATRRARVEFGDMLRWREQGREALGLQLFQDLSADVRYAFRQIRRAPAFAALAIATFAMGIGVNTAVFTVIDAIALKPIPVRDGANVFRLERWLASGARGDVQYDFSESEYVNFRDRSRTVTDLVAAAAPARVASDASTVVGQLVSDNFFTALGAPMAAGRAIGPAEGSTMPRPIIVLSHGFWERRFNADPNLVGTTVMLNGIACAIIGVTSEDFIGIGNPPQVPDFWAPLTMQAALHPGADGASLQLLGRLRTGEQPQSAQAELQVLVNQFQQGALPPDGDRTIAMTVERAKFFGGTGDARFQTAVALLMVCVGMLLIVASANVANMALARASSRQREMGVRLALGASRARVIRQLVTESVVLASLGGVAGLLASAWFVRWLGIVATEAIQQFFGSGLRIVLQVQPDMRVFGYAMAMAILAGSVAGLLPAAQASTPDLTAALKNEEGSTFGRRISRSHLRALLIGAQIAASVALLTTAGLLTRGLIRSQGTESGLETRRMFIVMYHAPADRRAATALVGRLANGLQQTPAIKAVTLVSQVPFAGTWTPPIVVDPPTRDAPLTRTLANVVSPSYFEAFGIPLVRGRTFSPSEAAANAPVAVISESLARALWPTADPVGKRFKLDMNFRGLMANFEVVGVAKDERTANISRIDPSYVYLLSDPSRASTPSPFDNWRFTASTILIRASGEPRLALDAVRATVGELDASLLPELDVVNLEDTYLRAQRLLSGALSLFALVLASLSMTVAGVGTYGTMSYLVSQRVREIGIRMALGARRSDILRLVVDQGFTPLAVGAALGFAAALCVGLVVRAALVSPGTPDLLFGVGVFDPLTFICLITLLAGVAILATYVPARRAMRVDPMVVLRCE